MLLAAPGAEGQHRGCGSSYVDSAQQGLENEPMETSVGEQRLALRPYARAVGWVLLRLLLQTAAALIASAFVVALCWLPRLTRPQGFRMMTAEGLSADLAAGASVVEYFQLVAECLFLIFVLVEFARALVRIARLGRPQAGTGATE